MTWLKSGLLALTHWAAFAIIASFLPFLLFVDFSKENLQLGILRVLRNAALSGDIVLMMIPLVAALLGESVIRSFKNKGVEIFVAISGFALFVLLIGFATQLQALDILTLDKERQLLIIELTINCFYGMTAVAASIMFLSAKK